MIKRFENSKLYNPIRSHIRVGFTTVKDYNEKIDVIANDLVRNGFDGTKSRVLIFVSVKKHAEESVLKLAESLKNLNADYYDKIDYYHGGLESSEREERTESYKNKNGETLILIATKAFGMGMDIPNVHFVYHLDPSSNFEDFLQEVGRAGRKEDDYLSAGFSEENPIKTNCIIANDDFKRAKDKLHNNQITWSDLIQVQKTIYKYVEKYTEKELSPITAFALPLDLLSQFPEFDENKCDETYFRVVLYWLEKLQKLKLGTYVPTHLPISILNGNQNYSKINNKKDVEKVQSLQRKLATQVDEKGFCMITIELLNEYLDVDSFSDVWRLLFLAQKAGVIRIERELTIEPTKTRKNELERWNKRTSSPIIETVFTLANKIMSSSRYNQQTHFEGEEIDDLAREPINECLGADEIFWKEYTLKSNKERSVIEIAQSLRTDFQKKRAKFVFKLIEFLPKAKQKSILNTKQGYEHAKVSQLIFNGYKNSDEWSSYLDEFKTDLYNLIEFVHLNFIKNNSKKFNVVDLLISLNIEEKGESYFKELIFIAKALGYLKGNAGGIVPMGVELFILNKNEISTDNLDEFETKIREEFEEGHKMKELRMLTLECLSSSVRVSRHDEFIKEYFNCGNLTDLVRLLEDHFGENHEILSAFRAEALKNAVVGLNDDQRSVYDAPKDCNLQVIAGPGSGKTHTLTLRVARLIQEEKIKPDEILVLAYNRAVVVELKDRLERLFRDLGYAKLTKRLKVFTFHGFCKYTLGEELDDVGFDRWTPRFLEIAQTTPGKISQKLGTIKYVFVDEFQDITMNRLELLKFIAHPKKTKICVIGDPNQSIYGYDRVNEGGERSPKPYYEEFEEIYKPKNYDLSVNYRSYIEILDKADNLLSLNKMKFEMPKMSAKRKYDEEEPVCEFYSLDADKTDWRKKLIELVESRFNYESIAVMFRSNQEVYRAYNEIRKLNFSNIQIRIQGAKGNLFSTREFHYFLEIIKSKFEQQLSSNYFEEFKKLKSTLLSTLPNWDEYLVNVFLCITYEFKKEQEDNSTYQDLYEFIKDISLKDDGQFGKVYQQNIYDINGEKPKREIVLTTMHKVKGIEYDAVIIPPSFSNLPQKIERNSDDMVKIPVDLEDIYEEERRLYYVAYTRAKFKLIVINWKREQALNSSKPTICEVFSKDQIENSLGILLEEGIDKFTLYWGASDFGRGSFETIKNHVRIGDDIILKKVTRGGYDFWEVKLNNIAVAQLSSKIPKKMVEMSELSGFVVSSIYVHTYEETVNSETGSKYAHYWNEESKKRGFIYLIDFSGYGKIIN
jgi:ATP-dependent DNA helicase RecQ